MESIISFIPSILKNQTLPKMTNKFQKIDNQLYWMPCPHDHLQIGQSLNKEFGTHYRIYNLSENSYNIKYYDDQCSDHCIIGLPCFQMSQFLIICKSILNWMQCETKNVTVVHCQDLNGKSVTILVAILILLKRFQHIEDALNFVINRIKQKVQVFNSQKSYLRNFQSLLKQKNLNFYNITINKIIFSEQPKIKNLDYINPYIQFFQKQKCVLNSQVQNIYDQNQCLFFEIEFNMNEDLFVRLKHQVSGNQSINIMRFMIHPSFMNQKIFRLTKQDVDISDIISISDNFFIDILISFTPQENEDIIQQYNILKQFENFKNIDIEKIKDKNSVIIAQEPIQKIEKIKEEKIKEEKIKDEIKNEDQKDQENKDEEQKDDEQKDEEQKDEEQKDEDLEHEEQLNELDQAEIDAYIDF